MDAEPPRIDEGRYVYCAVRVGDAESVAEDAIEIAGIDDEPVSVVATDGIGAVVHECDGLYDSADPTEIRGWLVRHQSVVDAAAEAFGTPLPFQFDTIVRGDDAVVREWLRTERETLSRALDALADHWEYRIEVIRTESLDDEALADGDERLAALGAEIEAADRGRAHLLEKRYENRLRERRRERRELLAEEVRERLTPHVREVHELEREPTTSIDGSRTGGDDGHPDGDRSGGDDRASDERAHDDHDDRAGDGRADGDAISFDDDAETVCRLTVLAHEDDEDDVGAALDEVAATDGVAVRFTGPWPPYTFTPAFGDGGSPEDG
nr:GvpL/GvpF family gas vesicle protein [Halovivax sp.]